MSDIIRVWDRFWSKVDKSGPPPAHRPGLGCCWIWIGAVSGNGYGNFYAGGGRAAPKYVPAHRYVLGLTASDSRMVDHLCRTPRCVNPVHLEIVDAQVNLQRTVRTRLSPDLVRWLRREAPKSSCSELARRLGISKATVVHAVSGRHWSNVQ